MKGLVEPGNSVSCRECVYCATCSVGSAHNYRVGNCAQFQKPTPETNGDGLRAKWIPCNVKEPEEGKRYLVTVKFKGELLVDIDDYFSYGWDDWGDAVVAWAEMPEPCNDLAKPNNDAEEGE